MIVSAAIMDFSRTGVTRGALVGFLGHFAFYVAATFLGIVAAIAYMVL